MRIDQCAAVSACAVLAALALFQAALIAGAPLGKLAWGGQHEVLPPRLKAGSAVSIVLYVLFGYLALAAATLVPPMVEGAFISAGIWVLTAYFGLGVVMNAVSRSKPERLVMTPAALVLTVLFLVIALT